MGSEDLDNINKLVGFDYLIKALKKCSQETRDEFLDELEETSMD